jgi:hypothetical protein
MINELWSFGLTLFELDNERSEKERRRLGLKGLKFSLFFYYFAKSGKGNTWNPMQVRVACYKEVYFSFLFKYKK